MARWSARKGSGAKKGPKKPPRGTGKLSRADTHNMRGGIVIDDSSNGVVTGNWVSGMDAGLIVRNSDGIDTSHNDFSRNRYGVVNVDSEVSIDDTRL